MYLLRFNAILHEIHGTLSPHTRQKRGAVMQQPSFVTDVVNRVDVTSVHDLLQLTWGVPVGGVNAE